MTPPGEQVQVSERVIVSPAAGVFRPLVLGGDIDGGAVLGHVEVTGGELVPVTSPFGGRLGELVAWAGERVQAQQRLAWLTAAAA